jgi:hypothetical protein
MNAETRKIIIESAKQCAIAPGKALKMWHRLSPAQKVHHLATLKRALEAQEVQARNLGVINGTPAS